MRRAALAAVAAAVAIPGAALASVSAYTAGTYTEGGQSGFRQAGIRIVISSGSFNVSRILMPEVCSAPGHSSIHDFAGFEQGTRAKLAGRITSSGNLSGTYSDGRGDYTKVTGHIDGKNLTVSGTEFSRYVPSGSTVQYTCRASGTFHPKP